MRFSVRRNVDLPQPEGPIKAVICRSGMATDTSWRAWFCPYHRFRLLASRMGSIAMPHFFRSFRPTREAVRLISRVSTIRMAAMEKARAVSPPSVA